MATDKRRSKLVFRDPDPSVEKRPLAVYTLDAAGKVLSAAPVSDQGDFDLTADAVSKASRVVIARASERGEAPDLANAVSYHAYDFAEKLRAGSSIELARNQWTILFPFTRCADGTVTHCSPWFVVADQLTTELRRALRPTRRVTEVFERAAVATTADLRAIPIYPICRPVCDGVIEVWRRRCCCPPWIIYDRRFEELKDRLRIYVDELPRWRPRQPEIDTSPIASAAAKFGTVDPLVLNAVADLEAISTLQASEQLAYVNARPYLIRWFCNCGTPQRVATGYLQPDGSFQLCWLEGLQIIFCWYEYAFIVKQVINGNTVTIYDGVASNNWSGDTTGVSIVTWHPDAIDCGDTPPDVDPGPNPAVFLQDIGITPAWRLGKPVSGIDPTASSFSMPYATRYGLIDPDPAGGPGNLQNRNLGGTLRIRFFFTENLKPVAKYYRLSYASASSLGSATQLFQQVTWNYVQVIPVPFSVNVIPYTLGPNTVGGQGNLFEIPYNADHAWMSGQWHAFFDTSGLAPGGYVLILELFNAAGVQVTPSTSAVRFMSWNQPTGPTDPVNVTYDELLSPLHIDNRSCYGDILGVSAPMSAGPDPDCLYLSGAEGDPVNFQYIAGFPDPNFLYTHSFWTWRGLSGPAHYLVPPGAGVNHPLPTTVGSTIGTLLGTHQKCAFAANLSVDAKTTDGIVSLLHRATDQIAFSLEKTP